ATSQGQANSFKARLERSEKIDSVELRDPKGNAGGITFTALINFKTGAFNEAIEGEEVANNG
ncbi:MAG: hypothetical protein OSB19_00550, partial [Opitutaceae bacterium]|nr:hypothetical protein [Opitutaceae bacterium]